MSGHPETVDLHMSADEVDSSASELWSITMESESRPTVSPLLIGPAAAVLLAMAGASSTVLEEEQWISGHIPSATSSATTDSQKVIGRSVSRREALQIARQILDRAEEQRLELAKTESHRGIQWDD